MVPGNFDGDLTAIRAYASSVHKGDTTIAMGALKRVTSAVNQNQLNPAQREKLRFVLRDLTDLGRGDRKDSDSEVRIHLATDSIIEQAKQLASVLDNLSHATLPSSQRAQPSVSPDVAATKIQRLWRGHSTRTSGQYLERHALNFTLFHRAKAYIDHPLTYQNAPKASTGKTPCYLPKELPIVLKQSGSPQNQMRLGQMQYARKICDANGYQNLVIPRARVHKNFIVESKLPLADYDVKQQIGLYIENRERFTVAVKELTGFLFKADLHDLTGGGKDPYAAVSNTRLGRYDNLPLYLEGGQGKIGLIDLEGLHHGCMKQHNWSFKKCEDLLCFFPCHFDEILEIAKNFNPDIEKYRAELEKVRDGALRRFKFVYDDHLAFIRKNNITLANPLELAPIIASRREEIKKVVTSVVQAANDQEYSYPGCLGENPAEIMALFEESLPKIFNLITNFLSAGIQRNIENSKTKNPSYSQLLSYRTLIFTNEGKFYKPLVASVAAELKMMKIERESGEEGGQEAELGFVEAEFATMIIQNILEELAKGGEIAYYTTRIGHTDKQCIFF